MNSAWFIFHAQDVFWYPSLPHSMVMSRSRPHFGKSRGSRVRGDGLCPGRGCPGLGWAEAVAWGRQNWQRVCMASLARLGIYLWRGGLKLQRCLFLIYFMLLSNSPTQFWAACSFKLFFRATRTRNLLFIGLFK